MKKSLISRFVIIAVIVAIWAVSMMPVTDRPFFEVMHETATPTEIDGRFDKLLSDAEAKFEASKDEDGVPALAERDIILELAKNAETPIQLNQYINIYKTENPNNKTVLQYVSRKAAGKLKKGIDLAGGTEFVVGFDDAQLEAYNAEYKTDKDASQVRDEIMEIIRNRIDQVGVAEPEIKPTGPTQISITVPAIKPAEVAEYRRLIEIAAKLDFQLVHDTNDQFAGRVNDPDFAVPAGYEVAVMETESNGVTSTESLLLEIKPTGVTGKQLDYAEPQFDEFGNFMVNLGFNLKGTKAFCDLTTANVNRRLAIVLDGKVYSAPNLNEPICGGSAQISGSFSAQEATQLAVALRCGNLPVNIKILGEFTTSATLGKDSVRSGQNAALWGLALVFLFMIIYYRFAGVIADVALAINIVLVLGTLTIAGATITLPGIAGIVLTIGMAVDANVLIFERIREELNNSKSVGNAVKLGYERAFSTIFDANITTLLTAVILFNFGTGPVKGFAVTLAIGIIASLFTALFVTRAIFDLALHNKMISTVSMMRMLSKTEIGFVNMRKVAAIVSAIAIVISLGAWVTRGTDKYSVDFMGGVEISYKYAETIPAHEIRAGLEEKFDNVHVAYKSSVTQASSLLEIVVPEDPGNHELDNQVTLALNDSFTTLNAVHVGTKQIGALVGKQFRTDALIAMLVAILGIIIYISLRFQFGYALGAVVALIHDVLIGVGVFLICGRQLSLPVIAALLTIIGYSLNDTIVVFDRVRENLDLKKGKFLEIVNLSLNQTLSRTVLTSITTLLVVGILFLFGGGAINDFALVMLVGVIVGTYSSIFVATPVMIAYTVWAEKRAEHAAAIAAANPPEAAKTT